MGKKGKRNKRDIAALRFSGGRYTAEGFPLVGIDELEKYQRLVIEAAKKIWRETHPDRKNLPARFDESVELRLTKIDRGSVVPVLERGSGTLSVGKDLLDLSIEYVDEVFESMVSKLAFPDDMPETMVPVAKLFGVSLNSKEKVTFRDGSTKPIRYTAAKRRTFLASLASGQDSETGTLIGRIRMLDTTQEFIFEDAFSTTIKGEFARSEIFDELHDVHHLKDDADLIWLACTYLVRPEDAIVTKIEDVTAAGVFASATNQWAQPLAELAAYPEGWLDGEGERIGIVPLEAALSLLNELDASGLGGPSIFADIDGGVRLEWLTDTSHSVLTVDDSALFSGYHLNIANGEQNFAEDLSGVQRALEFVRGYIGG